MKKILITLGITFVMAMTAGATGQPGAATTTGGLVPVTGFVRQKAADMATFPESGYHQYVADNFGIDLQMESIGGKDAFMSRYAVLLASKNLPDIVGGIGRLGFQEINIQGGQGLILEVGQYLNQMPNLSKYFVRYPAEKARFLNENGKMYTFGAGKDQQLFDNGSTVRIDILRENGMNSVDNADTPEKYNEVFEVLKRANDGKPIMGNPGEGPRSLLYIPMQSIGRSTGTIYYDQNSGQYGYPYVGQPAKDAIRWVRYLIEEGYYEPDVLTSLEDDFGDSYSLGKWSALMGESAARAINTMGRLGRNNPAEHGNAEVGILPPPRYNGILYQWPQKYLMHPEVVLGTSPGNITKIIEYVDFLYTELAFITGRFGLEGRDYIVVDGYPRRLVSPSTYTFPAGMNLPPMYTAEDYGKFRDTWGRINEFGLLGFAWESHSVHARNVENNQFVLDYLPKYKPVYAASVWPAVRFSDEDGADVASIGTALNTASAESITKILAGLVDLDTEWAKLQNMLERLDVQRYVNIYNQALR
jgi:ABC-type glycerol-3-phosphate transport system substrate-binding protein